MTSRISTKAAFILFVLTMLFAFNPFINDNVAAQVSPSDISVELIVNNEFTPIEAIGMSLIVTNNSNEIFTGLFNSSKKFDFIVMDERGLEIWKWSNGRSFTMAMYPFILKPGKTIIYNITWNQLNAYKQPLGKGTYKVAGELSIAPKIKTQVHTIEIIK
jgi:hypothetical protein